jgi:hypothetical protein
VVSAARGRIPHVLPPALIHQVARRALYSLFAAVEQTGREQRLRGDRFSITATFPHQDDFKLAPDPEPAKADP